MKSILLLKELYLQAFKTINHFFIKSFFKIFAWICFISFVIVLYAFIFRVATGFAFD